MAYISSMHEQVDYLLILITFSHAIYPAQPITTTTTVIDIALSV
jgi:hypothetical protein